VGEGSIFKASFQSIISKHFFKIDRFALKQW
jgi:hypothetical protein